MDALGDLLTGNPIQMGWVSTVEQYPSWQFGYIDNPDRHLANSSVWTQTRTRSDGPEPFLTLSILSQRRGMIASLRHWHRRRHSINRSNDWICPLIYIFTTGQTETKQVKNWLHGTLEVCDDMRLLLMMCLASSSPQNSMPRQLFQAFQRWSWHLWSL